MTNRSDPDEVRILSREAVYGALAAHLSKLGWRQAATMSWTSGPVPDYAEWRGPDVIAEFETDFDSGLKTLSITGEAPEGWDDGLDLMTLAEAELLIGSEDKAEALAGLGAARILAAPQLKEAVTMRLLDADVDIGSEAAMAIGDIHSRNAQRGASPAADIDIAEVLGLRGQRIQVMRWLGSVAGESDADTHIIINGALDDADWEVRATAMLTAARLGATDLAPRIARIDFPEDSALGLGRHENRILLALRDAALAMLGQPRDKALPEGLIDAIKGEQTGLPVDVAAFVHSLVTPLPQAPVPPPPAAGVELTDQGPQTTDGHLLAWVPPSAYWLGHQAQSRGEPNPARRVGLAQGFYIEAEAREPATLPEARAVAAEQARDLARPVHLASSEEWEMAARGPDGRRYPWGQNADPALRVDLSPCGMADIIRGRGEWLNDAAPEGRGLTTSGARSSLLSARALAASGERRAFRLVYPL